MGLGDKKSGIIVAFEIADNNILEYARTTYTMISTDRSLPIWQKYSASGRKLNQETSTGFTLLETLIVLLVLGIVAMVSLPALHGALEDSHLSGAASEVVNALEFAQLTAVSSGSKTRVTIDADTDTILVEQFMPAVGLLGNETQLNESDVEGGIFVVMGNPLNRGTDYNISFAGANQFAGADITSVAFGTGNLVVFDPQGAPSDGGAVSLTVGSRQVVVNLDSLSGKVSLTD